MSENAQPLGNLLSGLMENPEMLGKAMNIASTLASSGVLNDLLKPSAESGQPSSASTSASSSSANAAPDMAAIGNLLAGLGGRSEDSRKQPHESAHREDERTPHASHDGHSLSNNERPVGHSERIALLRSLRPFLPSDKQEKIDFVIKLLGLLDAAERMGLGKLF